jgi:outer membrane protein TolC
LTARQVARFGPLQKMRFQEKLVMKMDRTRIVLSAILAAVFVSQSFAAAPRRLSLQEALMMAKDNNHRILIARSQLDAAGGQNLEGWQAFLPKLTLSEGYLRSDEPVAVFGAKLRQGIFSQDDLALDELNYPDPITNFATVIRLEQPIINVDAISGKRSAGSAKKANEYALERTEEAVSLEVEKAYYRLILANSNLTTIDDAVETARTHYNEVKSAYDKGLVSKADLLSSQVRLAEMEEHRLTAGLNIANASDRLKFLLGMEDVSEIVPTDSLYVAEHEKMIKEVPLDTVPAARSDLQALYYKNEAMNRQVWMSRGEWIPRLNAFGVTEWHDEKIFGTKKNHWTVGVLLEWSVLDGLGQWGRKNQANAAAAAAWAEYSEAQARSSMEVRQAYRGLITARERMDVAEQAVEQSRESLRIVEARFQKGLERVSDLLTRESAYTDAQLRLQRAMHDFKVAKSELQFFLGSTDRSNER